MGEEEGRGGGEMRKGDEEGRGGGERRRGEEEGRGFNFIIVKFICKKLTDLLREREEGASKNSTVRNNILRWGLASW